MKGDVVDFYYFTGTGNTLLVVQRIAEVLEARGKTVNLRRLECCEPAGVDTRNVIGLGFPVAGQSTYPFVWDFMRALPDSEGTEAFMVDTMYGFSGAIVGPLKKVLKAKGYEPTGATEIMMPGNWFPKKIDEEKNAKTVEKGLDKAARFAEKLADGSASWRRVPLLSDWFYRLCSRPKVWKMMAEIAAEYAVDPVKCRECEICEGLCPVGNISCAGDLPVFGDSCQQCMRCLAFCPTGAITVPGIEYEIYTAVKVRRVAPKTD